MFRYVVSLALALCLTGAAVTAQTPSSPLTPQTQVMGIKFRPKGSMKIAAFAREIGGRVAICGVWSLGPDISRYIKTTQRHKKTLGAASVRIANRTMVRGLVFMAEVADEQIAPGTPAPCEVSRFTWQPAYAKTPVEIIVTPVTAFE